MTKAVWSAAAAAATVLFVASPVFAASTDTKTLNVSATVNARAKLTLSAGSISFGDADPDTTATITQATPLTVDVKTRTAAASNVTLTVLADGDLMSGSDPIAINNLTWTTGAGLSAGTMSSTAAVSLGSWTGSGNHTGMTQTYSLANSWTYAVGNYTAIVTYTLTAP
jgi:hypothetical protein